jgi:hypothetical protein
MVLKKENFTLRAQKNLSLEKTFMADEMVKWYFSFFHASFAQMSAR